MIDYITRVKAALPGVLVTTADVYGELLSRPALLDAVDVVLANYYPYWEGVSIEQAMVVVHAQHTKLANAFARQAGYSIGIGLAIVRGRCWRCSAFQ